ncbi:glutamyl-tRNA synthetase [Lactarius psammicola]|nr:glutamyl-tRNA synthetase [Lactarius psammicola]
MAAAAAATTVRPLLRFAPSPTGPLHLGGLRTALFNHAFARRTGGYWILRIEDTDASRTVPHSVEGIQHGLSWAGLDYDFGPGRNGPHGPYFQSERLDLYHHYARQLLDGGHAYRCFCSPDRLAQTRERLARAGLNSTYDKHCLSLSSEEVARRVRAGEKNVVRLNDSILPARAAPEPDLIFGNLRDAHASLPTDPVLLKSDLFPTYHLASVVDDHEMGITHVLRGEEWLASLPLHLDLYAALSLTPPKFAHLPLLLNPDGSKMSKRKGDVQVLDYMRRGWEPDAVLNWLALAGWGAHTEESGDQASKTAKAPDSTTVMNLSEIVTNFRLDVLTHRRTILDPAKLEYLNKHHLMRTRSTESGLCALALRAQGHVKDAFPHTEFTSVEYIEKAISVLQGRLVTLMDLPTIAPYFFVPPAWADAEARAMLDGISMEDYQNVMRATVERLKSASSWDRQTLTDALHAESSRAESIKPAKFMTALRHAMSGTKEMMDVLGEQRTIARLEEAGSSPQAWFTTTSRSNQS